MINLLSLSHMLPPLIWIGASATLFSIADVFFRYWYQSEITINFCIAFIIAVIGTFCLAMSFPHQNIAVATVICILVNITLYLILAYFIFGDIITYKEGIGLLLGFAAIYVLEGMK